MVGDTVGDPFKDTSSVAMNPVIKFTTLFGLLAVELAVTLTATQGSGLTHFLAAGVLRHVHGLRLAVLLRHAHQGGRSLAPLARFLAPRHPLPAGGEGGVERSRTAASHDPQRPRPVPDPERRAPPAEAIQETLQLAELADRLGYHRYWLAEHHNSGGLAGSAPEVLIGQVAAGPRASAWARAA